MPKKTKSGVPINPKTGKAMTGRPSLMTKDAIAKLMQAFALGCTDLEACYYANIGKDTLYNYQKDHKEFVERKEALKQAPILKARQELIKGLTNNPELALKYLERKLKSEFSTKVEQELTGANGGAIQTETTIKIIKPKDNIS